MIISMHCIQQLISVLGVTIHNLIIEEEQTSLVTCTVFVESEIKINPYPRI